MTVQTPPYVLQGGSHPASTFRQIQQGQMGSPFGAFAGGIGSTAAGGGHGVAGATDMTVSQNGTPNMSVNVAGGLAFIRGTESASQGVYGGYNDAAANLAVASSDPTNPRIDLVVLKVRDSFYSGAAADLSFAVVTGTPAASPAAPAVPNNALVIAQVAVAATSTTVLNAAITDKRTRAAALGGVIVCTSVTRPSGASLYAGMLIYETDTFRTLQYQSVTTGWTPAWNMPWGLQGAPASNTSNSATSTGTFTLLSATALTAVANRRLKITVHGPEFITTGTGITQLQIWNGSATQLAAADITNGSQVAGTYAGQTLTMYDTPGAGSVTYTLRIFTNATSAGITAAAGNPYYIMVEDMGPSSNPA